MAQILLDVPLPHDCEAELPKRYKHGVGTVVQCDCGQHYVLIRDWTFGHPDWKPISARRAERKLK